MGSNTYASAVCTGRARSESPADAASLELGRSAPASGPWFRNVPLTAGSDSRRSRADAVPQPLSIDARPPRRPLRSTDRRQNGCCFPHLVDQAIRYIPSFLFLRVSNIRSVHTARNSESANSGGLPGLRRRCHTVTGFVWLDVFVVHLPAALGSRSLPASLLAAPDSRAAPVRHRRGNISFYPMMPSGPPFSLNHPPTASGR
jgi:hypothetical protein